MSPSTPKDSGIVFQNHTYTPLRCFSQEGTENTCYDMLILFIWLFFCRYLL